MVYTNPAHVTREQAIKTIDSLFEKNRLNPIIEKIANFIFGPLKEPSTERKLNFLLNNDTEAKRTHGRTLQDFSRILSNSKTNK